VSAVPFLRDVFKFEAISIWEYAFCFSAGIVSIVASESIKLPLIQRLFSVSRKLDQNKA
jgi:hypothetical protein